MEHTNLKCVKSHILYISIINSKKKNSFQSIILKAKLSFCFLYGKWYHKIMVIWKGNKSISWKFYQNISLDCMSDIY